MLSANCLKHTRHKTVNAEAAGAEWSHPIRCHCMPEAEILLSQVSQNSQVTMHTDLEVLEVGSRLEILAL